MQGVGWPRAVFRPARGQLFLWVPVFIGCGVGAWFSFALEPGRAFYLSVAATAVLAGLLRLRGPEAAHPPAAIVLCIAAGLLAAGARAHLQRAPVLDFRYYGPILGRVIEIDRSQSDAMRLTLDHVQLDRTPPARTPDRVRISLHGEDGMRAFAPGQVVMTTGHLSAPQGAVEPGGFDFARMAYFDRLGAVGYTRSPVLLWADPAPGAQIVNRLRSHLSGAMMAAVPGDAGAFAAGVMTGDRSGLSLQAVVALRDSSLAHLLAISGMNMAFLTAFVFALLRYGIALVPPLALRVNAKKLAATVSFGVALFYLLLSGANVATERAFIMVAVMLGAILLDRRALTLRSVALSATVILLWKPESLLEPGFQMSFAATVALIAGFGALEGHVLRERLPRWVLPVFTLVLSSAIGGIATAPYAAAHFNRFADYGFVANLLTVPVMGAVVMPAGAVAALLAPVGLAAIPLWIMEQGARWILFVAHRVAAVDGAVTAIPAPGAWALPLITLGAIWLIVWQGRIRLAGIAPVAVALALWAGADRPALLIDAEGGVVGLMGDQGRAISAATGAGFATRSWLENDGDLATQETAAAREGFTGPKGERRFTLGAWRGVVLSGKGAEARLAAACAGADLVILGAEAGPLPAGCTVIDRRLLAATGPLAIVAEGGGFRAVPTVGAARLWTRAETTPPPVVLPGDRRTAAAEAPGQ